MNPNLDAEPLELEWVKFARIERPRPVYFYKQKDTDGDVIEDSPLMACREQEAGMFGQFHKLVGVGDGVAYYESLKTAKVRVLCKGCGGAKIVDQAQNVNQVCSACAGKKEVEINGNKIPCQQCKGSGNVMVVQMIKIACDACNGLGTFETTLKPKMVIPIEDARRILQEANDAEWEVAEKDPIKLKKMKPRYENRSFDSTVLMHDNSQEIMNSFGRKTQPKPWKPGEE